MNAQNFSLAESLVSPIYIRQASEARKQREKKVRTFLSQRGKLPKEGWDITMIELFLTEMAVMDSNNFTENVGVGEREARIFCELVSKRHFRLGHGIGRSGDVSAIQPKAAGSSLIVKLTTKMASDILKVSGIQKINSCLVLPLCTGMSVTMTLLALRNRRPKTAQYVIWPRIDQKSCLKAIITSGFIPSVIENIYEGDELRTDIDGVKNRIEELGGPEYILCILSTTSCFAPRAPDKILELGKLCNDMDIPHIINNAYGVQSTKTMHLISESCRIGRVDAIIQSTDKNFLVPVGGAIIFSPDKDFIKEISQTYPGRASGSPIIDLFITLLSMGENGYRKLLKERKELYIYFSNKLKEIAEKHGERLLNTPNNPISLAISLNNFVNGKGEITYFGSMLFSRCCSGMRVVSGKDSKDIGPISFVGYGSHTNNYPIPYMTAAVAIGVTKEELDIFIERLDKTMNEAMKKFVVVVV